MIDILTYVILGGYILALIYVTVFCLMQFHLLYHYRKHHKGLNESSSNFKTDIEEEDWPFVTIQLPIFNEKYVIERLIDRICALDYPKDKFEVHVLDDSNDETVDVVAKKVAYYKTLGFHIDHIQREKREGFKAGALRDGMQFVKGEFIAIFDADFLPEINFLKQTIPHFSDPEVGVVQTKWAHINENYSLITRMQAFQLNVHFTVEQQGRESGKYLLQFNGTAGIWRKQTIYEAGGWEADTLTEDLDLSYRAQLKGWKINFLEEVSSPAELPAEMNGLKSQQFRWMKGGAETAKKILPTIWKSDISMIKKIHATSHLMSSSVFLFVFMLGVFSVPIVFLALPVNFNINFLAFFLIGLFSIIVVYFVANVSPGHSLEKISYRKLLKFVLLFPIFLALSMGLSLHNSVAVIQGLIGKKSPFVRTPKLGIKTISDKINKSNYLRYKISVVTILEGLLACYFLFGLISGIYVDNSSFLLFHFLLFLGYGIIFFYSLKHMSYRE